MGKVFDAHLHFDIEDVRIATMEEGVESFRRGFEITDTDKFVLCPVATTIVDGKECLDLTQNLKSLFFKKVFSPKAYAFGTLEKPVGKVDKKVLLGLLLDQIKTMHKVGFDGVKMLESTPYHCKAYGYMLDDMVYDEYFAYCEENRIPITMHIANPAENWDITKVSQYAIEMGWYADETYPTKRAITDAFFKVLERHPKLRIFLAHFGFFSYDIRDAERFMSYPNTICDMTPGGEQLVNMSDRWDIWKPFYEKYQDRIIFGTDTFCYSLADEKQWINLLLPRHELIHNLFETDYMHQYVGVATFKGISLDEKIRDKIYYTNAARELGEPSAIDMDYFKERCKYVLTTPLEKVEEEKVKYILEYISKR